MAVIATCHEKKKNARVDTVKVAVVEPAGIVTLDGTLAIKGIVLDKLTVAPPVGAGPLNVTVPVERPPPITEVGFRDSEANATPGVMVKEAVLFTPL